MFSKKNIRKFPGKKKKDSKTQQMKKKSKSSLNESPALNINMNVNNNTIFEENIQKTIKEDEGDEAKRKLFLRKIGGKNIHEESENSIRDLKFKENEDLLYTLQQSSFFHSEKDDLSHEQYAEEKQNINKAVKSPNSEYKLNRNREDLDIELDKEKILNEKFSFDVNNNNINNKNYSDKNKNKILSSLDDIKENSIEIMKSDFERIIKEKSNYEENLKKNQIYSGEIIKKKIAFFPSDKAQIMLTDVEGNENAKEYKANEVIDKMQDSEALKNVQKNTNDDDHKQIKFITNIRTSILKNKKTNEKLHNADNNSFPDNATDFNNNNKIENANKFATSKSLKKESYPTTHFKENIITNTNNNEFSGHQIKKNFNNKRSSSKMIRKLSVHCVSKTTNDLIKINRNQISKPYKQVKFIESEIKSGLQNDFSTENLNRTSEQKQNLNNNFRSFHNLKVAIVPSRVIITPNYNFKLSYDNNEENEFNNANNNNSKNTFIYDDEYFYNQSFARTGKGRKLNFDNQIKEEYERENVSSRYSKANIFNNASNKYFVKSGLEDNTHNNYCNIINNKKKKSKDKKESNLNFQKFLSTKKLSFYPHLYQSKIDLKKQSAEINFEDEHQIEPKYNFNQSNLFDNNKINNSLILPYDINFKKYVTIDDELLLLAFQKIAENSENNKLIYLKKLPKHCQASIFTFFAKQKLNTFLLLLNLILSAMMEPCFCIILSKSIAILSGDKMNLLLAEGKNISLIYFFISFIPFIVNYFQLFLSTKVKAQYISDFKLALHSKLQRIHFCFYDVPQNFPAAALCAKINSDLVNVNSIFFPNLEDTIKSFVLFFVGITIAFTYEWRLTLIGSVFIPLLLVSLMVQFKFKKQLINNINKLNQEANCIFIEAIRNSKVIFGFGIQKNVYRKYKHFMKDRIINLNRQNLITGLVYGLEEFINFMNYCFSFYFGGNFILNGSLNFGTMMNTVFAIATFLLGLAAMHKGISEYPVAKLSVDRLFSILNIQDFLLEEESESENFNWNNKIQKELVVKENFDSEEPNLETKPIKNSGEILNSCKSKNESDKKFIKENDINIQITNFDFGKSSFKNNYDENNPKTNSEGLSKYSKSTWEFSQSESNLKKDIKGKIQFKNVYFSYPQRPEEIVLKGVNFTIEPGQDVAIVGSLDSGKSIVIDLIERFYDVSHGEILIDDINIKNYDLKSLRNQIGYVIETAFYIKSESIVENLKCGNPQATEADVNLCLEKFGLLKLVEFERENTVMNNNRDNDKDYNIKLKNEHKKNENMKVTAKAKEKKVISETSKLDFNELQILKISLARAKLKNPKIIIFDNLISYKNYKSEKEIDDLIKKASEKTTAIKIIDKPFDMKIYDLILYFEDGIVIEQGKHRSLLEKKGCYYRLYNECR